MAQLARAVHGLESNPRPGILQQPCGHGRACDVVDGRWQDRVLQRWILTCGRTIVAIWSVLVVLAGREVTLALLDLLLWWWCLQQ